MRIQDWYDFEKWHPVYERGDADRWVAPLPGMKPAKYKEDKKTGEVTEPLGMVTDGFPSVDIHRTDGGATVQQVRLNSKYAADMDITEIQEISQQWFDALKSLAHGPYSLYILRLMGHPYGYGEKQNPGSWDKLKNPRRIPSMGRTAYARGMRGRVSDKAVINEQSGAMNKQWFVNVLRWYGGVNLVFGNRAFYAWFLAHGTIYMQAHGPWEEVARRMTPKLHTAWRRAAYKAWRKKMQEAQRDQASIDSTLGENMSAAAAVEFENGGFA